MLPGSATSSPSVMVSGIGAVSRAGCAPPDLVCTHKQLAAARWLAEVFFQRTQRG